MDQELMTIIQNIEALIQQAKQAAGAEASEESSEEVTPEMLEKIMRGMDGEEEKEEEKAEKAKKENDEDKVEKSDEGPNASDKAEARAEENPTEENINEVAKALAKMLIAKKSVKKSDEKAEFYKVMKSLAGEVVEVKKAVNGILEGLGVSEKIIEHKKPMNNLDEIQKSLDAIKELSGKKASADIDAGVGDTSHFVSKSLASNPDLLRGLFGKTLR